MASETSDEDSDHELVNRCNTCGCSIDCADKQTLECSSPKCKNINPEVGGPFLHEDCAFWYNEEPCCYDCYWRYQKKAIRSLLIAPPCAVCQKEITNYKHGRAVVCFYCNSLVHYLDHCLDKSAFPHMMCKKCKKGENKEKKNTTNKRARSE